VFGALAAHHSRRLLAPLSVPVKVWVPKPNPPSCNLRHPSAVVTTVPGDCDRWELTVLPVLL